MSEIEKPKKIRFLQNMPEGYKIYPVNGLWGGVSARGDLICHFFLEHIELPKEEVQSVKEDGLLGPVERKPKEELTMIRDMQVGIVINLEQAVSIANWILQSVKQFEDARKGEPKK